MSPRQFRLAALAAAFAFAAALAAPALADPVKCIVLVHGAWVDASGWKPVYDILTRDGYQVSLVEEPLTSLADDVAATTRAIDLRDGPCILVAHSYGGSVITEAGMDPRVVGLVYVAVSYGNKTESLECNFRGDRERIRLWASQQALDMLRRRLM